MKTYQNKKRQMLAECCMVMAAFAFYMSLACFLPVDMAPDEYMRYDISSYIYRHGTLPAGYEAEIRNGIWGFSYAFTPYLPSILAAGFMRLFSVFSRSAAMLQIAARMVSVLSAAGCTFLAFRIGERMGFLRGGRYLYAVLISFLPQFVFLAAYLNNDMPVVFSAMLMFYAWLRGREKNWDKTACILLAVGISICALTYYNAYGWILSSVIFFCYDILKEKENPKRRKTLLTKGALIAGIVLLLTGWFFIRNGILYDGDFLGMHAQKLYGEMYAQEAYKPSNRPTFANEGGSIWNMLTQTRWIPSSVASFFAAFGYMSIFLSRKYYICYIAVILLGLVGFIYGWIRKKYNRNNRIICLLGIPCTLLPVVLSAYNSWVSDFQAQGRYFMPALPMLMYYVAEGYGVLEEALPLKWQKRGYLSALCALGWAALFLRIFLQVMVPNLYIGI